MKCDRSGILNPVMSIGSSIRFLPRRSVIGTFLDW